jgi:ankyrin repeat protein
MICLLCPYRSSFFTSNTHLHLPLPFLSQASVDVNQRDNEEGLTPLFAALRSGHEDKYLRLLLKAGTNVNLRATPGGAVGGGAALSYAAAEGLTKTVKMLIKEARGVRCNVNIRDDAGATPMILAAFNGHVEVICTLIQHGASVDAAARNGATALIVAAQKSELEISRFLVAAGASVNLAARNGATAILLAAQNGNGELTKFLATDAGANVHQDNNNGSTPLHVSAFRGHTEVATFLLSAGASVNRAATNDGASPLCLAAQKGFLDLCELFIRAGADANQAMKDGGTPLHVCAHHDNDAVAQV